MTSINNIRNAPVFHGGSVYIVNQEDKLVVLDPDTLQTLQSVDLAIDAKVWPVVWDNCLYLRGDFGLYKWNGNGIPSVTWERQTDSFSLLPGGRILEKEQKSWDSKSIKIRCFDLRSVDPVWAIDSDEFTMVYTGLGVPLANKADRKFLLMIDAESGQEKWRFALSAGQEQTLRPKLIGDEWLIIEGDSGGSRQLHKVNLASGSLLWSTPVPFTDFHYDSIRDQFIGFGGGRLVVLDGLTGELLGDYQNVVNQAKYSGSQQSFKLALDPSVGKLVFDISSEKSVIGCLDYENQEVEWLSPFADIGTIRVGTVWFNKGFIHIFDSTKTLRVGRHEGDHLTML